jgi:hypothetical protein
MDAPKQAPRPQAWPPSLLELPLNRAATRLLKLLRIPVHSGIMPLSQAILEGLQGWNGSLAHDPGIRQRLLQVGEAETPEQFAQRLQPFLTYPEEMRDLTENLGCDPYSPETLAIYTPKDLAREAGKCKTLQELLNILAGSYHRITETLAMPQAE